MKRREKAERREGMEVVEGEGGSDVLGAAGEGRTAFKRASGVERRRRKAGVGAVVGVRVGREDIMARLAREEEDEEEEKERRRVEPDEETGGVAAEGSSYVAGMRRKFEDIMGSLRADDSLASGTAQAGGVDEGTADSGLTRDLPSDAGESQSGQDDAAVEKEPPERIKMPEFSYRSNPNDLLVEPPGPTILPEITQPQSQASDTYEARDEEPEDTLLGSSRPPSSRKPNQPLSLWQKVQEAERRPQWGGVSTGDARASKASFDSLRAADKRSPEPVISTAGETRAWGSEPSVKDGRPSIGYKPQHSPISHVRGDDKFDRRQSSDSFSSKKRVVQTEDQSLGGPLLGDEVSAGVKVTEQGEKSSSGGDGEGLSGSPENAPNDASEADTVATSRAAMKRARQLARRAAAKSQAERRLRKLSQASEQSSTPAAEESASTPVPEAQDAKPLVSSLPPAPAPEITNSDIKAISTTDLSVTALNIGQPPVPPLQYGLDRALFNPGVYQLQDPHSRVYNFDPYLQNVMPITEFDFNALKEYKSSSQDDVLSSIAKQHEKKFIGSTSSMTATLGHFHYLLSNWRDINLDMLSRGFKAEAAKFTNINRAPNAIFLRHRDGTYAIDADKEHDSPNVLMMLGKSMEKLLTLPKEQYERYRKGSSNPILDAEKEEAESYEYTTMGNFLMRSQLDAYDSRLPGQGTFDLKTRAVVSIRMDAEAYKSMLGYEIHTLQGNFESYEREYYDMLRSTMLKYMLQARMGRMDGIFMAYHNIERIFGFQYLSLSEIDRAMHGQVDRCLGDQEFRASLHMMDEVLQKATEAFPGQSLRLHFETVEQPMTMMWVFAEPVEEAEIEAIQGSSKERVAAFEREVMGVEKDEGGADAQGKPDSGVSASTDSAPAGDGAAKGSEDSYTSSLSPADPAFVNDIHARDQNLKPLFAATLICQNYVNGAPSQDNRVRNLLPKDKWEVQYILKEAQMPPAEKWARYEDCKTRRRRVLVKFPDSEEGEEAAAAGGERRENGYLKMLRSLSEKGRVLRRKLEGAEGGREKVVFGEVREEGEGVEVEGAGMEGLSEEPADARDEEGGVESVDDYMDRLYGLKQ